MCCRWRIEFSECRFCQDCFSPSWNAASPSHDRSKGGGFCLLLRASDSVDFCIWYHSQCHSNADVVGGISRDSLSPFGRHLVELGKLNTDFSIIAKTQKVLARGPTLRVRDLGSWCNTRSLHASRPSWKPASVIRVKAVALQSITGMLRSFFEHAWSTFVQRRAEEGVVDSSARSMSRHRVLCCSTFGYLYFECVWPIWCAVNDVFCCAVGVDDETDEVILCSESL